MAETEKKKYKLYALPLTNANIEVASNERFSRATPTPAPGYVLIYTDGKKPNGAKEITANNAELLATADKRWLFDSNAALIAEEIEANRPQIIKSLSESVEKLEHELKQKQQELAKGV